MSDAKGAVVMVIIKVCGGLGNQLFQFALYQKMRTLGKDVYLDNRVYKSRRKEKRPYCLDGLSEDIRYCSDWQRRKLANNRIHRILWGGQKKQSHYYEKKRTFYDSGVFLSDDVYLDGYWQNEGYFSEIRKAIINGLCFTVTDDAAGLLEEIKTCNSVSVHVRRGDYLEDSRRSEGICTLEYYQRSMAFMEERTAVDRYYIFSDDIDWCREQFGNSEKYIFVNPRSEEEAAVDMKLMSSCSHNIIANSSFSWWAAWLNENPQKIVAAPNTWIKGQECDIWCRGWERL